MKRQNLRKLAVMVFVTSMAVFLVGGGFVANAKDQGQGPQDKNLFVYADTVAPPPGPSTCTVTNRYQIGQEIIFRVRVTDNAGRPMDGTQVEEVFIRLPSGDELDAEFGTHPPSGPTDAYWTAVWDTADSPIPIPTGSFSYQAVAVAHGHHVGTFEPFNIGASLLTIMGP